MFTVFATNVSTDGTKIGAGSKQWVNGAGVDGTKNTVRGLAFDIDDLAVELVLGAGVVKFSDVGSKIVVGPGEGRISWVELLGWCLKNLIFCLSMAERIWVLRASVLGLVLT